MRGVGSQPDPVLGAWDEPGEGALDVFAEAFDGHAQGRTESGNRFPVRSRKRVVVVESGHESFEGGEVPDYVSDAGRLSKDE